MAANLGELILGASATYADHVAFQVRRGFRMERLTFRQVGELALKTSGWLHAQGIEPGDRVAVWAPNMPEYAILYFGAWIAGAVVVPIDIRTQQDVVDRFVGAATPAIGFRSSFIEGAFGPPVRASYMLEQLLEIIETTPPAPATPIPADALCEIAFTSGTTGVPKGVTLTHANLLAEVAGLREQFPLKQSYRALSLLPLSHILEQAINLLLAFTSGVRMTYVPRVNSVTILRALREERITCFIAVPELLRIMIGGLERNVKAQGKEKTWAAAHRVAAHVPMPVRRLIFRDVHKALGGCLEFIGSGSAPLDAKLASTWERMGVRIFEGYGLTEVAGAATLNNRTHKRSGTVGKPLPGVEVRIAEDGEIHIRGDTVTQGYYGNAEITQQAIRDGWLHTGDVGKLDADGFLHISGREAFKIVLPDGHKVYPEDVEVALNAHPLVRESCVVGLPRGGGESVHAVLLTEHVDRAGEIIRETNRALAPHQQIAGYSVWESDDLPRTPILKIDRRAIRAAIQAHTPSSQEVAPPATAARDPLARMIQHLSDRPGAEIRDDAELGTDLGLDSIGRVELLAMIEDELGRVIDEMQVGPQTTLGELRSLVDQGARSAAIQPVARWPRARWARAIGGALLWIAFRMQDHWMKIEIVHPERLQALPFPSILIFNYQGPYVPLVMLRAIPKRLRSRVTVAADDRLWLGRDRWQGLLAALAIQAFPFTKSGGAVRPSLEEMGRWLDDGYAVILSPEGDPEVDGELLPFLSGVGLMAVEMRAPIVPFRIEQYHEMFEREPQFPFLPVRKGRARLVVGEPFTIARTTPYDEATERARRALVDA